MKKQEKPTYDELNKLSKDMIIKLFLNMQESFDVLKSQNEKLLRQMDAMQESLLVLTQNRFGRKTEKTETFDPNYHQLSLFDTEEMKILNEAEHLTEDYGILVTDGYQVYHTLQKENPDKLTVSGLLVIFKTKVCGDRKGCRRKNSIGNHRSRSKPKNSSHVSCR
jgi:hypothetical protein